MILRRVLGALWTSKWPLEPETHIICGYSVPSLEGIPQGRTSLAVAREVL